MKYRIFYTVIIVTLFIFFSSIVSAQEKTTVKASVDRSQILIGQHISLKLEADIPGNEPILFFQIDSIPHFEFLDKQKIDTLNTSTGTQLSQVIKITSFDSGHWSMPAFPLGDSIFTDTLPIDVQFSPFDTAQAYHDVKDIIEVKPVEKKEDSTWWYIGGGALLLIIILFLAFRKKKKKPAAVAVVAPIDPFKQALADLEQLRLKKPEAKQYYSGMVNIFRIYIEQRKGILSLQNTTDDLVKQLKGIGLATQQFERLAQALRTSDSVKFAKYIPTKEDDAESFETIKKSIQMIEEIR